MATEPMFQTSRFVSETPRAMEEETMMNSKKIETIKKAIMAVKPVVPVHLKKYCLHPVVVCWEAVKVCCHIAVSILLEI